MRARLKHLVVGYCSRFNKIWARVICLIIHSVNFLLEATMSIEKQQQYSNGLHWLINCFSRLKTCIGGFFDTIILNFEFRFCENCTLKHIWIFRTTKWLNIAKLLRRKRISLALTDVVNNMSESTLLQTFSLFNCRKYVYFVLISFELC